MKSRQCMAWQVEKGRLSMQRTYNAETWLQTVRPLRVQSPETETRRMNTNKQWRSNFYWQTCWEASNLIFLSILLFIFSCRQHSNSIWSHPFLIHDASHSVLTISWEKQSKPNKMITKKDITSVSQSFLSTVNPIRKRKRKERWGNICFKH